MVTLQHCRAYEAADQPRMEHIACVCLVAVLANAVAKPSSGKASLLTCRTVQADDLLRIWLRRVADLLIRKESILASQKVVAAAKQTRHKALAQRDLGSCAPRLYGVARVEVPDVYGTFSERVSGSEQVRCIPCHERLLPSLCSRQYNQMRALHVPKHPWCPVVPFAG